METEKKVFIDSMLSEGNHYDKTLNFRIPVETDQVQKGNAFSKKARKEGNLLFLKKSHSVDEHQAILRSYCASIAFATPGSEELAFGFGNRSVFLMHLKKYQDGLKDIERALATTCSPSYKIKLLCRKAQANNDLDLPQDHSLVKAKHLLKKIPQSNKIYKTLSNLIDKTEKQLSISEKTSHKIAQGEETASDSTDEVGKRMNLIDKWMDVSDSVDIKHNEKYQCYLIANRDFQPGEVVFAEELYSSCLNVRKRFTNCSHCLNYCWSLIPCNECNWALFCSETCKREAYGYHSYECSFIPQLKYMSEVMLIKCHLPIRLLFLALNEAGGLDALKAELEKIDATEYSGVQEDVYEKELSTFGNNYKTAYRMKSHVGKIEDRIVMDVCVLLIKKLFKYKGVTLKKVQDLISNDQVLFIGALFLRFYSIRKINSHLLSRIDDICNHPGAKDDIHTKGFCMAVGNGLALLTSLINHSCLPNISRVVMDNRKMMVYALRPIQKGDQLFDSYQTPFYESSKEKRQVDLEKYQFICDCEACKNDWPVYDLYEMQKSMFNDLTDMDKSLKLHQRIAEISGILADQIDIDSEPYSCLDRSQIYRSIIHDISDCISKIVKRSSHHCMTVCGLYHFLRASSNKLYGFTVLDFKDCYSKK